MKNTFNTVVSHRAMVVISEGAVMPSNLSFELEFAVFRNGSYQIFAYYDLTLTAEQAKKLTSPTDIALGSISIAGQYANKHGVDIDRIIIRTTENQTEQFASIGFLATAV